MKNLKNYLQVSAELAALEAELKGMLVQNKIDEYTGMSPTYGQDFFEEIADKMRKTAKTLNLSE